MSLRIRFSLRVLLVLFTIVSIVLGGGLHYLYEIKEQIRRHKEALAKLKGGYPSSLPVRPALPSTAYGKFVRRWIDSTAFEPVSEFHFGVPLYRLTLEGSDFGRYRSRDLEPILEIAKDLYGVPEMVISVDRLTLKMGELIAEHSQLKTLYIDCLEIEPGATRPLQKLRGLNWFCMPSAIDDDAMRVLERNPKLEGVILNLSTLSERHASLLREQKSLKQAALLRAGTKTRFLQSLSGHSKLTRLNLHDCEVDEVSAQVFSRLPSLEQLQIEGDANIDRAIWTNLASAKNLKTVDVMVTTRPSSEGVRSLAKCLKLEALNFESVTMTIDDLLAFARHPALKQICFLGKFPDQEIETFLKQEPKWIVGVYKDTEGFGPGKTGLGLRGKYYRLVEGKLDKSTSPFLGTSQSAEFIVGR